MMEQLDRLERLQQEIYRRVRDGALSGEMVVNDLQRLLGSSPYDIDRSIWPLSLELGKCFSVEHIRFALEMAGTCVASCTNDLLGHIWLVPPENMCPVELIDVTGSDLGLSSEYSTQQWLDAVHMSLYHDMCAPECGPLARLAFSGDENIAVAMQPVKDSQGCPRVFYLDGVVLSSREAHCERKWHLNQRWLVIRRDR